MLETERLILRTWRDDDLDAYTTLHADPHVAYWLGGRLTPEQAAASLDRNRRALEERISRRLRSEARRMRSSARFKTMLAEQRSRLPAYAMRAEIAALIGANQVTHLYRRATA